MGKAVSLLLVIGVTISIPLGIGGFQHWRREQAELDAYRGEFKSNPFPVFYYDHSMDQLRPVDEATITDLGGPDFLRLEEVVEKESRRRESCFHPNKSSIDLLTGERI